MRIFFSCGLRIFVDAFFVTVCYLCFLSVAVGQSRDIEQIIGQAAENSATDNETYARSDGNVNPTNTGASGLTLPRFVSLGSGRVNVRVGPDRATHAVAWVYTRQGLPVEIIEEYDNWRRIRDGDGDGGWVDQAFLSGRRTAMSAPWRGQTLLPVRKQPSDESDLVAEIEPLVIGDVHQCTDGWCELAIKADCSLIEPLDDVAPSIVSQFLSDFLSFSFGDCHQTYQGWLKQTELWGVYPGEEF